jgi:hypothetical protein
MDKNHKLHGLLNLSKIDKSLIVTLKDGSKAIYVDILENLSGPDQYGNTHTMTTYNKDTRTTTYLGNFKPQEFGKAAAPASHDEAAQDDGKGDLPF